MWAAAAQGLTNIPRLNASTGFPFPQENAWFGGLILMHIYLRINVVEFNGTCLSIVWLKHCNSASIQK